MEGVKNQSRRSSSCRTRLIITQRCAHVMSTGAQYNSYWTYNSITASNITQVLYSEFERKVFVFIGRQFEGFYIYRYILLLYLFFLSHYAHFLILIVYMIYIFLSLVTWSADELLKPVVTQWSRYCLLCKCRMVPLSYLMQKNGLDYFVCKV